MEKKEYISASQVLISSGKDLPDELVIALDRTIQATFPTTDHLNLKDRTDYSNNTFFIIKDNEGNIDALGRLRPIELEFEEPGQTNQYQIQGISDIIVSQEQRRKGYGRKIMREILNYLNDKQEIGIGFCNPSLIDFYRSCGFRITENAHEMFFPGVNMLYDDPNNQGHTLNVHVDAALYSDRAEEVMHKIEQNPQAIRRLSFILTGDEKRAAHHW